MGYQDGEFTLYKRLLFKKERIVIPCALRERILKEIHAGHSGIVRMKGLARNYVWWKGLDADLERTVKMCEACAKVSNNPSKVPVHHWVPATKSFERLHIDFARPFLNRNFFVCVDAFTKWPEVYIVNNIVVSTTIEKCEEIFSRFGIPKIIVSDNGTTFISEKFQKFLKLLGIKHIRSAPYDPAINVLAERFVQTLKRNSKKSTGNETIQQILSTFLFYYRITPIPEFNKFPSELMFGRTVRNKLDLLFPEIKTKTKKEIMDNVRSVEVGDKVLTREYSSKNVKWRKGIIKEKLGKLHYVIEAEGNTIWKRHIDQIKKIETNLELGNKQGR